MRDCTTIGRKDLLTQTCSLRCINERLSVGPTGQIGPEREVMLQYIIGQNKRRLYPKVKTSPSPTQRTGAMRICFGMRAGKALAAAFHFLIIKSIGLWRSGYVLHDSRVDRWHACLDLPCLPFIFMVEGAQPSSKIGLPCPSYSDKISSARSASMRYYTDSIRSTSWRQAMSSHVRR
jgi:hypothetical protein